MMREDEALAAMRPPLLQPAGPRPGLWKLLREDVRCVLERDPAARSRFEVWTIYPGVQAVALHRAAHALWQRGWRFLPRAISFFARWLTNVDIHPAARIGRRFFIDHGAGVVIGETAEVGDDVTMYHGVTLGGTTWNPGKRHPSVGHGALIGAGAKILGAIEIGQRARIAANSVVIEDVPEGATVVGNPGRVVIPRHRRQQAAHGFDLDHHLIPDPVGKAIGCLLERVAQLEQQLQARPTQAQTRPPSPAAELSTDPAGCSGCDDSCAEPTFGALARRTGARP